MSVLPPPSATLHAQTARHLGTRGAQPGRRVNRRSPLSVSGIAAT